MSRRGGLWRGGPVIPEDMIPRTRAWSYTSLLRIGAGPRLAGEVLGDLMSRMHEAVPGRAFASRGGIIVVAAVSAVESVAIGVALHVVRRRNGIEVARSPLVDYAVFTKSDATKVYEAALEPFTFRLALPSWSDSEYDNDVREGCEIVASIDYVFPSVELILTLTGTTPEPQ